jgi:CRP-like cAMP-binding protein
VKLEALQKIALFADLSEKEQQSIAARLRLQHYEEGSLIFTKDSASIGLYIIKSGWVQLIADGGRAALATLGPGNILGEADCFLGRPRSFAAQATADADVWVLDVGDLESLIGANPELGLKLGIAFGANLVQFERYLVEERLKKVPFLARLSEDELMAMANYLQPLRLAPGDAVFNAGDPPSGLYLVERGLIRFIPADDEGEFSELTEGNAFGEMAVLSSKPYTATARAAEETILWQLTSDNFASLTAQHPSIRLTLSRVLRERLSAADQAVAVERLRGIPLFSQLNDEALAALAEILLLCHIPAGQIVFAQGDPGDAMYLIENGEVEIGPATLSNVEQAHARLLAGDFFGEIALLTGKTRSTTARAVTNTNLWVLYRSEFDTLIVHHPTISLALTQALRVRLMQAERRFVERHLRKISFLGELSDVELSDVAGRLQPERYRIGELVVVEGTPGETMYFVEDGQVELTTQFGNTQILLDRLAQGDFFGEMAVLTGNPQVATVRAVTDLNLWRLGKKELEDLLNKYPNLTLALSRAMGERLTQTLSRLKEATRALPAPQPPLAAAPGMPPQAAPSTAALRQPAYAQPGPTTPPATPISTFSPAQPAQAAPAPMPASAPAAARPVPSAEPAKVPVTPLEEPAHPTLTEPALQPQPAMPSQPTVAKPMPPVQPAMAAPTVAPQPTPVAAVAATTTAPPATSPAPSMPGPTAGARPTPGRGPSLPVGGVQAIQEAVGATVSWFAALSLGAKLRILVVVLLIIWLCGISAPAAIISLLGVDLFGGGESGAASGPTGMVLPGPGYEVESLALAPVAMVIGDLAPNDCAVASTQAGPQLAGLASSGGIS